jgi:NADH-quinone oxidoreductase subunit E
MNQPSSNPPAAVEPVLTGEMREAIQALFPRYPTRRAVVLPALDVVHDRLRQVPPRAVIEIAQLLGLAPAEVQDTLTFYGSFHQHAPHGRYRVQICRSISCALRGGEELLDYLCRKLGLRPGETTADGRLTLEFAECLGACESAPCMLVGDRVYANLTREKVDEALKAME